MRVRTLILPAVLAVSFAATGHALTFTPPNGDLQDLPHEKYFRWGIDYHIPNGQAILSASVVFHQIYNWADEPDDRLWMHLLQQSPEGLRSGWDYEADGTWFAPPRYTQEQILLNEFANLPEGYSERQDITYTFDDFELEVLNSYALAGNNFGLGFDPDCHYYNCGIDLNIETGEPRPPVPEPATVGLLGLGLVGFGGLIRRKSSKA